MSTSFNPPNIIKCSIGGGKKGTLLIQKTSLSLRRCRSANLEAANETKKRKSEDITFPDKDALDIYDNSSGHNCMAKDALSVSKLNIGIGGKNPVTTRDGYYLDGGHDVQ